MYEVNEELKVAIGKVEGKGETTVSTGTTGGGKSAVEEASASHPVTQNLLAVREASGKGSVTKASTIVTDYEAIPEDKLIMTAELHPKTVADCGDDNELLGNVLYAGAKDYFKNPDKNLYKTKLSKSLTNLLEHPANDSLGYKLKDIGDDKFNTLMEVILKFEIPQVMIIYNEMLAKTTKKGQKGVRTFIELLSSRESFSSYIEEFWNLVIEFINQEVEELREKLEENGAVVEEQADGGYRFTAVLGEEDIDSDITEILLKSEEGSKEYLLSNVSLIFRGADYIFDVDNKDALTVAEIDGVKIHCIRIIDTQGLFHATGVKAKDEAERIVDLLSEYHSSKLLLVVNSFVTDTVKDGYDAISMMLQEVNRDIEVYILFTHWDEYLKSFANQSGTVSRFSRRSSIDWEEKYKEAYNEQQKVIDRFKDAVATNTSKKKPHIIDVYRAAILSEDGNKMEDVLDYEGVQYPVALNLLVSDMVKQASITGGKYRVVEGIENTVSIDASKFGKQNISALYSNLVNDCKNLKLYASTVRACNRKWVNAGNIHKSDVVANDYGFQNIETSFVREIRNYAMNFVMDLELDANSYLLNQDEEDKFLADLMSELVLQQNVGREVAKMIGSESYTGGFVHATGFKYQYERFTDMIQYAQDNYFIADKIYFTAKFERCLIEAAKKCIRDFVDSKCIVVY